MLRRLLRINMLDKLSDGTCTGPHLECKCRLVIQTWTPKKGPLKSQTEISTEGKTCVRVSQVAASVFKLEFRALAISKHFLKIKNLKWKKKIMQIKKNGVVTHLKF